MKTEYQVIVQEQKARTGYAVLSVRGRTKWRTLRIAQHHAYEYKATHLRDAWVEISNYDSPRVWPGKPLSR